MAKSYRLLMTDLGKNKTVFKGGEFLSIKELLQFDDAATRFAKIEATIDELLRDNPNLTTRDINKLLYRQFGTRIHKGTISWNGETVSLRLEVYEQIRHNTRIAMGLSPTPQQQTKIPQQSQTSHSTHNGKVDNPLSKGGGSTDANREWEISGGMDVNGIDDENSQRAKWRR